MFNKRKGITPVIAIVLLLLVTVGAVGVVYTQFQDIAEQGDTNAGFLDNPEISFTVATRNTSSVSGVTHDTINISLENTGDEEYNLSQVTRLEYTVPTEGESLQGESAGTAFEDFTYSGDSVPDGQSCFTDNMETFGPGDLESCNTGMQMSDPDDQITIQLVADNSENTKVLAEYTCSPSTSDSTTC